MGLGGCRSSGDLTSSGVAFDGRCKLVSIHGTNLHATDTSTIIVYDNTAASGKIVAYVVLPALRGSGVDGSSAATFSPTAHSMEFDMHGVICTNGLYFSASAGTPHVTIEYS
tara:strand:+ start:110 stop:445 length:336 start_codon:yes stop_codon:yes gene_type:complete